MSPHSKPFNHFVASCYIKWLAHTTPCTITMAKSKYKYLQYTLESNLIKFSLEAQNVVILRMTEFMYDVNLPDVAEQAQRVINEVIEQ